MSNWRISAIQLPACGHDLAANRATAARYIVEAARQGADLALLPELATVPYFCGEVPEPYRSWAETRDGPLITGLAELCRKHRIAVLIPFYERDASGSHFYNGLVAIDRDGCPLTATGRGGGRQAIRKLHLPVSCEPPGFDEPRHFEPGDGVGVFSFGALRVGCLICYDRRFPECWRELRALGAHLVAVPVAGSGGDSVDFYLGELRTHARENGVMAFAANKIGRECFGGSIVDNYGESCVVSAEGEIVARRRGTDGPGLVIADVDLDEIMAVRRRFPYFEDRRLDLYPAV